MFSQSMCHTVTRGPIDTCEPLPHPAVGIGMSSGLVNDAPQVLETGGKQGLGHPQRGEIAAQLL